LFLALAGGGKSLETVSVVRFLEIIWLLFATLLKVALL